MSLVSALSKLLVKMGGTPASGDNSDELVEKIANAYDPNPPSAQSTPVLFVQGYSMEADAYFLKSIVFGEQTISFTFDSDTGTSWKSTSDDVEGFQALISYLYDNISEIFYVHEDRSVNDFVNEKAQFYQSSTGDQLQVNFLYSVISTSGSSTIMNLVATGVTLTISSEMVNAFLKTSSGTV